MAQRIDPMDKISQKSVGFNLRQLLFFAKYPNFKPDPHCRRKIDDQIAEIDPSYLSKNDERRTQ